MSKKTDENDLKGELGQPMIMFQHWFIFILESIMYNPIVQRSFGMFGGDSSSKNDDAALDWLAGWWPIMTLFDS